METSQQQKKLKQQPITKAAIGEANQQKQVIVPTANTQTTSTTGIDAATDAINKNGDYFIFGGFLLFIAVVILQKFFSKNRSGKHSNSDQYGTARFAHVHEIKELTGQYHYGDVKVGTVKDLKVLTKLVFLPRDTALKHTLIVGPTGAGKSRSFFLPNCHDAGNSSFVATDPKSELWNETAYNQRSPIRFAPTDPDNSTPFNFVAYCKDIDYAENVAGAIVHGSGGKATGESKFWSDAEEELMTGILLHIAHSKIPTPTHFYNLLTSGVESIANVLQNSPIPAARRLVAAFMESDKKNKSSVIQGLSGKLRFLNNPAIRRFTSSDENVFNFGQLRKKPCQVYWCLRQDDVEKLETLTTIFFSIVITQLLKQTTGKVPVNLYFDEFANVGKIKKFEKHITLMRGQGVAINAGLQSISQLATTYGKSEAETILDNFNNKLLLSGIQGKTAEEFSRQLGQYTYVSDTESYSESGSFLNKKVSKNIGTKEHARDLKTADELRRLDKNQIILISTNLRPVMMKKLHFTKPESRMNKKWNPEDSSSRAQLEVKVNFQCGQELPAPEYNRIEPTAGRKRSFDDI
jgi:type IV secretion system protein VirD4